MLARGFELARRAVTSVAIAMRVPVPVSGNDCHSVSATAPSLRGTRSSAVPMPVVALRGVDSSNVGTVLLPLHSSSRNGRPIEFRARGQAAQHSAGFTSTKLSAASSIAMPLGASSNSARKRASAVRFSACASLHEQQRPHGRHQYRRIGRMHQVAVGAGAHAPRDVIGIGEGRRQIARSAGSRCSLRARSCRHTSKPSMSGRLSRGPPGRFLAASASASAAGCGLQKSRSPRHAASRTVAYREAVVVVDDQDPACANPLVVGSSVLTASAPRRLSS